MSGAEQRKAALLTAMAAAPVRAGQFAPVPEWDPRPADARVDAEGEPIPYRLDEDGEPVEFGVWVRALSAVQMEAWEAQALVRYQAAEAGEDVNIEGMRAELLSLTLYDAEDHAVRLFPSDTDRAILSEQAVTLIDRLVGIAGSISGIKLAGRGASLDEAVEAQAGN